MTKSKRHTALQSGFRAGFTAPFLVFGRRPMHLTYRDHNMDTVATAWVEVGKQLSKATEKEGKTIGEKRHNKEGKLVVN